MKKLSMLLISLSAVGCSQFPTEMKSSNRTEYIIPAPANTFYTDKLKCETTYTRYSFFTGKEKGDIYQEGSARDCMMSKGYKEQPKVVEQKFMEEVKKPLEEVKSTAPVVEKSATNDESNNPKPVTKKWWKFWEKF